MHGEEAVYEMLWDCKFCGQKKLLGVTHRFCAGCGAPQDPAARYFPPDNEKVAVKDHPYVGVDVVCPSCKQPMSRAAKCCTNCGGPIDKGAEVGLRADVVVPPPGGYGGHPPYGQQQQAFGQQGFAQQAMPHAAPKKSHTGRIILGVIGGIVALFVTLILVAVLWKREGVFAVTGHTWERSIAVERYEVVRKSVWCDEVPASGRVVSRRREQNGTKKEPDGQTCATRKKDMGNGSFKEVKECTPKYKQTPVYEDKCEIDLTEWHTNRTASEKGVSLGDAPRWPVTNVKGGICLGCEREGSKNEKYTVQFTDPKSAAKASCDLPQAKWSTFKVGSKWKGQVRVMTDGVDCDGLSPQ